MTDTLFVRFSTAADIDNIVRFYQEHRSPYVFPREYNVWKERAEAGAVTLIEDAAGNIVASSISYPIVINGVHKWTEIGSTLIALEGTGLFKTLISAQVLRAALVEPPQDGFVLEIVVTNERSIEVFEKVGGKPFEVPPDLFAMVQETFTAESKKRDVRWFRIGPEETPVLAKNIMGTIAAPELKNKHTGQEYRLDFSKNPLQTQFLDSLKAMVAPPAKIAAPGPGARRPPDMT